MSTKKIGKFIAEKRRERNYTQAQLAEMLGVTSKTISRWENGNYMPDLSMLMPLCEILGIQVEELLKGENEVAGKSREELEKEYYEKRIKEQRSQRLETIASYVFLGIFVIFVFGGIIYYRDAIGVGGLKIEKVHMIWAALISGPIAIFYLVMAVYEAMYEKRMRNLTAVATGRVTGLVCSHLFRNDTYGEVPGGVLIGWGVAQGEQMWSGMSSLKKRVPPWFPCVKYEVDGKEIQKITGEGVWKDTWEIGQKVMVLYDPEKPSICRVEDDPSYRYKRNVDLIIGSVVLVFCIVTAILAVTME